MPCWEKWTFCWYLSYNMLNSQVKETNQIALLLSLKILKLSSLCKVKIILLQWAGFVHKVEISSYSFSQLITHAKTRKIITWIILTVEALGWQSTPCFSSFSNVSTLTCSISIVNTPHLSIILSNKSHRKWQIQNNINCTKYLTSWQIPPL